MSDAGRKIIEGLKDAVRGNLARVRIDGQTWVRHDAESPEGHLVAARQHIGELTERIDVLEVAMDEASDTAGKLYQMVGRLQPRLGGDGRQCIEIMDALVALSGKLETASNRKARHDTQE